MDQRSLSAKRVAMADVLIFMPNNHVGQAGRADGSGQKIISARPMAVVLNRHV